MSNQTLGQWVQNQRTAQPTTIDGQQLLKDTLNHLSATETTKGGGCGAFMGLMFLAPVVGVPFLIVLVLAANGVGVAQGLLAIFAVILVLFVIGGAWLGHTQPSEGKARLRNPEPATQQFMEELGAYPIDNLPDEKVKVIQTIAEIAERGGGQLRAPDAIMVDPSFTARPRVLGRVVLLPQFVLNDRNLPAVIAHLLYRIAQEDGVILLSLSALKDEPERMPNGEMEQPKPLHNAEKWRAFWRQQVFAADAFVVKMGYGSQLLSYLQASKSREVPTPHLLQEEPYIAERMARVQPLVSAV
jgi:hypothetical protein